MSETPRSEHRRVLQTEFERAAKTFGERTQGRFDHMGVLEFSRSKPGDVVVEVGSGTGNFLALFEPIHGLLVAIDVTHGMLVESRQTHPATTQVVAEGERLPLPDLAVDLVACAQMFHHVWEPGQILLEMGRVTRDRVLVVDQVSTEDASETKAMTELETLRDPSHAISRPPSEFRRLIESVGLRLIDERLVQRQERFSSWMWPGEFPDDRIEAVKRFIEARGDATGLEFEKDGDDYVYVRRRMMLLAGRN